MRRFFRSLAAAAALFTVLLAIPTQGEGTRPPPSPDFTLPDSAVGEVKGILVDSESGRPIGVVPDLMRDQVEGEDQKLVQARMNAMESKPDSVGAFHWVKVPTGYYHLFTYAHGIIGEGFTVEDGQVVDLGVVAVER